jgi:Na+/H+ antiporter NhaC
LFRFRFWFWFVLVILVLVILVILGLPAKLHGTSAQGTAHPQCAPSSALSTTGSFASGLVIVE